MTALPMLPPGLELRPPWPDEIPRLKTIFNATGPIGAFRPLVLVAKEPERLVGGVLILEPDSPSGIVSCLLSVRPAWRGGAAHEALLDAAGALTRELGAHTIAFSFTGESPDVPWLESRGARIFQEDVFYEGNVLTFRERISPLLRRAREHAERFVVRPLREDDHAPVSSMVAAHGLMDEERARARLSRRYDPRLCMVCTEQDRIVGAILTISADNGRFYIENRVVAPDYMASSSSINLRLLDAISMVGQAAGFTSFRFSCQPGKDRETVNFARRCGCRAIRRQIRVHLRLTSA